MTKDYKDVPRGGSERRRKERRKSSVKKAKPKVEKKRTPGWIILLAGAFIGGVLVAVSMFLLGPAQVENAANDKTSVAADPVKQEPKVVTKKTEEKSENAEEEEPRFDFYTLLPKFEVIIPESEIREEQEKLKPKEDVAYMIQVGSFRNFVEAETLKAQLAFLGIEADIEAISSKGETWQRVRVGPFTEKRELNRIRNRLHSNDYNTMLVKVRKDG